MDTAWTYHGSTRDIMGVPWRHHGRTIVPRIPHIGTMATTWTHRIHHGPTMEAPWIHYGALDPPWRPRGPIMCIGTPMEAP